MPSPSAASTTVAQLLLTQGKHAGTKVPVQGDRFLIGRGPSCQLRPTSPLVSRQHAAIEIQGDEVILMDLGSRNGTFLNGEEIQGPVPLQDADRIEIGPLIFIVLIQREEPAQADDRPVSDDDISAWLFDEEPAAPSGLGAGEAAGGSDEDGPATWPGPNGERKSGAT